MVLEDKVLWKLQLLCSRREYCSSDVYKKALKALDGDVAAAGRVLSALVEDKFVDDLRYAAAFAREKSGLTGWGQRKIRYMLAVKGVKKEAIEQAMVEIDGDAAGDKLKRIVLQKFKALKRDPQCKLKLLKYAMGRGYDYEDVKVQVEAVLSGEDEL